MVGDPRDLDTFSDGYAEDAPWTPSVGERVEVKPIASIGITNLRYFGVVESIRQGDEEYEYIIRMDNNPWGDRPWFVHAAAEDLEPEEVAQ